MKNENLSNIIDISLSLQERETEIELLQQTFTEIGSELDLDRVFQIVAERARKLLNAETLSRALLGVKIATSELHSGEKCHTNNTCEKKL